ncbi:MAG: efflux RND transporter periplasmic adaptor subunit [Pirellulaceae bacterium]|jgi:cobalt-zinc-cadmium efflux system membrane fusion protein|nr:efflux RND transporter periplasmic adaptor subunit [Pirellulaceae bacterium]
MHAAWPRVVRNTHLGWILLAVAAVIAVGWWYRATMVHSDAISTADSAIAATGTDEAPRESGPTVVELPRELWAAAELEFAPVKRGSFVKTVELTGKIALNEDRVAHIFPLVDGRVDEVRVKLGQHVKQGDLLVVVQSKEVGQSMLQLFQNRLQRDFAVVKDRWTQSVAENTQTLINLIREGASIDEIEKQLQGRPIGEFRDKLMTAYIGHYKAKRHLDRLAPLSEGGAVTGRQLLDAESEWNASRATLQSLIEQLQQEAQQSSTVSTQALKELETRVSVDETNLKILGYTEAEIANVDPAKQGETISHYPVTSPFDGTIITKDVVLLERVGPERQILSIADLSTVWVAADIYEEHLPLLSQLDEQKVLLRSSAWPGRTFEAQIFYTGDLVDESTRTVSMRAIADNREGHLKPGMFVNVEFPGLTTADVLQVPKSALLDHEGKTFVFVVADEGRFERRDVQVGQQNREMSEILSGLQAGESVVSQGGFALKSRMLAELLSE